MIPLIDAHLDLAWNAVNFERDLTLPVEAVNLAEQGLRDSPARGGAVVTLEEMRRGGVCLCFGTLLARTAQRHQTPTEAPTRINLDHRQNWGAYCAAHAQLAWYSKMAKRGQIRLLTTREELDRFWEEKQARSTDEIGVILVMEGADPIAELSDLDSWYEAGLRQINLVHYGTNRYAAGTGGEGGLTTEGCALLDRCSQLGIALDTTHLADQAFFEATDRFSGPLLASHQNCRSLVEGVRQFTDAQLRIVIGRDGVVGAALDNWMLIDNWKTGVTPREAVTLESVADHIDHVCQLAGHHRAAAIGTDLDGGFGREQAPHGVDRIGDIQRLAEILAVRNYTDDAIEDVFHGNWLRWLRSTLPSNGARASWAGSGSELGATPSAQAHDRIVLSPTTPPVVVVGAGSIGERHARCFARTGRVPVALCDVNQSRLDEVAGRLEIVGCYTDFDQVLSMPLTAAVIATPAPFHLAQAGQLLEKGIPVLIEKPLSTTMEGVQELIALAEQRQVPVAVAYVLRCHPVIEGLRNAVAAGEIGRPLEVIVYSGQCFPYFRPAYRDTYYARRASGGGAIQDALTHFLNAAQWIVGPMTQVQADAQRLMLEGVEVEDTVHVIARHGDVLATFVLNQHQAANETSITIVGSQGMLRGEFHANAVHLQKGPQEAWAVDSLRPLERDDLFLKQADLFLDCIEKQSPPVCTLSEAATTLAAQLAILRASDEPTWTEVPGVPGHSHSATGPEQELPSSSEMSPAPVGRVSR